MTHHNHLDASWLFIAILTLTWIAIGLRELYFAVKTKQKRNSYENQGEPHHDHGGAHSHQESYPPGCPKPRTTDTPGIN
jgi:ABC-type nickel/cobalt efflux system permease component RcnA